MIACEAGVCWIAGARDTSRLRRSQALPEGSSDFRTHCEQSSIIFEHCPKLFELCSMSSDRVTIDPMRKQNNGRMRDAEGLKVLALIVLAAVEKQR